MLTSHYKCSVVFTGEQCSNELSSLYNDFVNHTFEITAIFPGANDLKRVCYIGLYIEKIVNETENHNDFINRTIALANGKGS